MFTADQMSAMYTRLVCGLGNAVRNHIPPMKLGKKMANKLNQSSLSALPVSYSMSFLLSNSSVSVRHSGCRLYSRQAAWLTRTNTDRYSLSKSPEVRDDTN